MATNDMKKALRIPPVYQRQKRRADTAVAALRAGLLAGGPFRRLPGQCPVAYGGGFSPLTVAGPLPIFTAFPVVILSHLLSQTRERVER